MAERRRATIVDVARAAGISAGAVSLALNGKPGVATSTRERVVGLAQELGYRPSAMARGLSTSRAYAVGMVIARPLDQLRSDPFFPAFTAGMEQVLSLREQVLVLQVVPDGHAEQAAYRRLAEDGRVDGVVLSDLRVNEPRPALLHELRLPAVTLGRPADGSPWPSVVLDDLPGVTAAVAHLRALGHQRIAHVAGPLRYLHAARRQAQWQTRLRREGLPAVCVTSDFTAAGGALATGRLLDRRHPPTAIVYANDVMALAGMAVAARRGLAVPRDLSVIGYDDVDLAAHVHPALTTVRSDVAAWGAAAATALLALVEHGHADDVDLPAGR